jgi:hypothetical protein
MRGKPGVVVTEQKTRNKIIWLYFSWQRVSCEAFTIFAVIFIGIVIDSLVSGAQTYKGLKSVEKIDHVDMLIESQSSPNKEISIVQDSILDKINRSFRYIQKFTPVVPKMPTVFIVMDVHKRRKLELQLLKTTYSGWSLWIHGDYYRDDSLIAVLNNYLDLDSIR